MLTKGNFTRDEWNNLLHLSNASHFSSICCAKIFSLISCSTMAKRIQDQKEEERVVSKSRPAAMNISSFVATSSSTASGPIASKSLGMPIASVKPDLTLLFGKMWSECEIYSIYKCSTLQIIQKDFVDIWKMVSHIIVIRKSLLRHSCLISSVIAKCHFTLSTRSTVFVFSS